MVSAATAAAVSASISTPVCAVVSATARISTASPAISAVTSTFVNGNGWQSGINSLVRFAAMMPASCAVVRASPFGSSRSRRAVSPAMRTVALAVARRRDIAFAPTSTIRTSPVAVTCESSSMRRTLAASGRADCVEHRELPLDPRVDVVLPHVLTDRFEPAAALRVAERQRAVESIRLRLDVVRVHALDPVPELGVRTGVFRKDNGTVPRVHERRLFGHEVHPVHRGVHEQNVELLVRRDRSREVVRDLELDRQPGELL